MHCTRSKYHKKNLHLLIENEIPSKTHKIIKIVGFQTNKKNRAHTESGLVTKVNDERCIALKYVAFHWIEVCL